MIGGRIGMNYVSVGNYWVFIYSKKAAKYLHAFKRSADCNSEPPG